MSARHPSDAGPQAAPRGDPGPRPGPGNLAIALDTDDLVAAVRLARAVRPYFAVAKVGLELFIAAGPDAVAEVLDLGYQVFLDLKLHDIPTTVGRAARAAGSLGVSFLTIHTSGGPDMLAAGVEGFLGGAAAVGAAAPMALGVTILTSDRDGTPTRARERAEQAWRAGCRGVVTAAANVEAVRAGARDLFVVTPGIRPAGSGADDHAEPTTPARALQAGADLLVVGRAVSAAADPARAAEALLAGL